MRLDPALLTTLLAIRLLLLSSILKKKKLSFGFEFELNLDLFSALIFFLRNRGSTPYSNSKMMWFATVGELARVRCAWCSDGPIDD